MKPYCVFIPFFKLTFHEKFKFTRLAPVAFLEALAFNIGNHRLTRVPGYRGRGHHNYEYQCVDFAI